MGCHPNLTEAGGQGKIYIVVAVFNRRTLTERLLHCMNSQSFRHFEIIVVDDGSTDCTAELIADQFPEVQVVRGDGTLWWTGATNVGIRHAMDRAGANDAILVINNDLEVGPDYLENLHRQWTSMPDTLIGSVAVDIENPDSIVDGGTIVNWWTAKERKLNVGQALSQFGTAYSAPVSWLTGRGTVIPINVFWRIGLYNAKHYQQCGDPELPVRAHAAGFRLVVSYACVVKTHTKASYGVNVQERYTLRDLENYFFGVGAYTKLKIRWFFAYDTAKNPVRFVSFLLFDLARITGHFLLRLQLPGQGTRLAK
jgi:GT2 family glycosyltransferase